MQRGQPHVVLGIDTSSWNQRTHIWGLRESRYILLILVKCCLLLWFAWNNPNSLYVSHVLTRLDQGCGESSFIRIAVISLAITSYFGRKQPTSRKLWDKLWQLFISHSCSGVGRQVQAPARTCSHIMEATSPPWSITVLQMDSPTVETTTSYEAPTTHHENKSTRSLSELSTHSIQASFWGSRVIKGQPKETRNMGQCVL